MKSIMKICIRTGRLAILCLLCLVAAISCKSSLTDALKVKDYKISGLAPTGFSSVSANLSLSLDNNYKDLNFTDIYGEIYRKDTKFADFNMAPFSIPKGSSAQNLKVNASLAGGMNLLSLLSLVNNPDISEYTVTLHAKLAIGKGKPHDFTKKNLPLSRLLK